MGSVWVLVTWVCTVQQKVTQTSFIDNIHFFVWTLYFNNSQKRWLLLTWQNESFVLGFLLVAISVGAKQTTLPTSILSCYSYEQCHCPGRSLGSSDLFFVISKHGFCLRITPNHKRKLPTVPFLSTACFPRKAARTHSLRCRRASL